MARVLQSVFALHLILGCGLAAAAVDQPLAQALVTPTSTGTNVSIPGGPAKVEFSPGAGLPVSMMAATAEQEKRYWAIERARVSAEKDLFKIRNDHFKAGSKLVRQAGFAKLRQITDAAIFPVMVSVLRGEEHDVQSVMLDHFAEQRTDDADAMLAWLVIFDKSEYLASGARQRLEARQAEWKKSPKKPGTPAGLGAPESVTSVVLAGLSSKEDSTIRLAGSVARNLKLFEIIPALIQAQLGQVGTASGGGGVGLSSGTGTSFAVDDGSGIAWILIGRQIAYVADLTPVVSNNAVAFDPQLGVVTNGVVIRVIDAAVYAYRVEIHNQLVELAGEAAGKPMGGLGWDQDKWLAWWKNEMQPKLAAGA